MSRVIAPSAEIDGSCEIGENVVIEDDVKIGPGSAIGHGTVVFRGTEIGGSVSVSANSVLGRQPRSGVTHARQAGEQPPLRIGDGVIIGACVVLYAGTTVEDEAVVADLAAVRENCRIGPAASIGRNCTVECNAVIGARTKVQTATHITGDMVIEEDVFVGSEVSTMNDKHMVRLGEALNAPLVKRGAAIGCNASILPGVVIGEDAIVGAGAVVVEDVPDRVTYISERGRRITERRDL